MVPGITKLRVAMSLLTVAACGPDAGMTTADETTHAGTSGDTGPAPTGGPTSTSTTGDEVTGPGVTGTSATGTTSTGTSATGTTSTGTSATGTTSTGTTLDDTSTTSTSTGTSSTTDADTGGPVPCQTPTDCQPIFLKLADDKPSDLESGWVICNDESVYYREEAVDCAFEAFWPACEGQPGECSVDADCPGNQACRNQYGQCSCTKQCMSDSECEDGEICLCADSNDGPGWLSLLNTCAPADCIDSADCTGECGCRGSQFFCGTVESAFCPTVADECSDDDDCGDGYCGWNHDETRWTCEQFGQCE